MRLLLAYNPRSGSGAAQRLASAAHQALSTRGHCVLLHPIGPGREPLMESQLDRIDTLLIAGGDGSVRSLAPLAIATRTPVYHLPAGNENLFARHFGMTRDSATLLRAVELFEPVATDTASVTIHAHRLPQIMLLMLSVGPDAGVIARLHTSRHKPTGHRAYLTPILDELRDPTFSRFSIAADGQPLIENVMGALNIANNPQYALRLNPSPHASVTDGLLDLAYLNADTPADALPLLAPRFFPARQLIRALASTFHITFTTPGPHAIQIDGEALPPMSASTLDITAVPQSLLVLVPPVRR